MATIHFHDGTIQTPRGEFQAYCGKTLPKFDMRDIAGLDMSDKEKTKCKACETAAKTKRKNYILVEKH